MAVLLDTRDLAPAERNDAVRHVIEFSSGPSFVGHDCPAERISGLMEYWQLGNAHILRSSDVGLHLSRNARDLRKSAPEMLAVGIHLAGTGTFANADVQQVVTPGDLYLNDMTASYEYAYAGAGAAMAFVISYEQFGVPVDVARRANGRLAASPVYDLMTGHLARLCRTADELPDGPARAMLGTATIELMRALISSAAGDDPRQDAALNDALFTRVVIYVQEHLTDRDLCAEKVAREHHISVRHLYNLWAGHELSLGRWITRERLERARRDLAGPRKRAAMVATTAHRWGFADPTHFSRKFSEAYGMSPREWRQLHQ